MAMVKASARTCSFMTESLSAGRHQTTIAVEMNGNSQMSCQKDGLMAGLLSVDGMESRNGCHRHSGARMSSMS